MSYRVAKGRAPARRRSRAWSMVSALGGVAVNGLWRSRGKYELRAGNSGSVCFQRSSSGERRCRQEAQERGFAPAEEQRVGLSQPEHYLSRRAGSDGWRAASRVGSPSPGELPASPGETVPRAGAPLAAARSPPSDRALPVQGPNGIIAKVERPSSPPGGRIHRSAKLSGKMRASHSDRAAGCVGRRRGVRRRTPRGAHRQSRRRADRGATYRRAARLPRAPRTFKPRGTHLPSVIAARLRAMGFDESEGPESPGTASSRRSRGEARARTSRCAPTWTRYRSGKTLDPPLTNRRIPA